ncbi:MAG TPA: hypothetical protein VLC98_01710 [Phnomibacter sp.]|nr:hypothetical protein [Phnomibacter sp.]
MIHFRFSKCAWSLLIASLLSASAVIAQDSTAPKKKGYPEGMFKDTLDGKLDFSRFLLEMKGFLPIPMIITEPAVGGFGGVLALAFLSPKKVPPGKSYVAPDITIGFGMYTANNSWMAGGGRIGSFPKAGIKYRAFAGFGSLNLDFYRDLPQLGEKKFGFNIKAIPLLLSMSKSLGKSDVYLGLQYSLGKIDLTPKFLDQHPEYFPDKDFESRVAQLAGFVDIDKHDNFFTPNKGYRVNVLFGANDNWTGSDYEYQKLTSFVTGFYPIKKNWISGIRFDAQHIFGKAPFYLLPSIDLRGVPKARYQGVTTALVETEQRIDFKRRWSAVVFGGLGKAMMDNQSFGEANLVYNYGTGFRYLLARAFGIRAGIDVAGGPDSFGWYIVVGHNWTR